MHHGKSWLLFAAMACLVLSYFFLNGGNATKEGEKSNNGINTTIGLVSIELTDEAAIPQEECRKRGLYDMAIVLESEYCSACNKLKPTLEQVEKEAGVPFLHVDLGSAEGAEWTQKRALTVYYTPTVIINCEVIIGAHEKQDYLKALERAMDG